MTAFEIGDKVQVNPAAMPETWKRIRALAYLAAEVIDITEAPEPGVPDLYEVRYPALASHPFVAAELTALPPCGKTHAMHTATWRTWRDDCLDEKTGCGYAQQDPEQCAKGHPDDGIEQCGGCGHGIPEVA